MEPESYLDVAVTKWLPRRWENANYESALDALATRFEERHGDRWLRDVLAAQRSERLAAGLAALAEAVQANLADESEEALRKSTEAAEYLRAVRNRAGVLRAELEQAYALHRAVKAAACVEKAVAVGRQSEAMQYSWIHGQALMEQGNCRAQEGDPGTAHRDMARALDLARNAGYHDLELRASGILAGSQTEAGNLLATWKLGREGLANYWTGPYSGIRAQQIYFNLVRSAQSLGLRQAAYVLQRASAMAIAETPRRRTEATMRAYVARLALEAGWPEDAKTEFDRAGRLFDQLQQPSDREYRTLGELYRAEAEAASGDTPTALRRLEAIRPSAERVDATLVRINFQTILGVALQRSGKPDEAETAYQQAIGLSERRLDTLRGYRNRTQHMLVAGQAYRGLVEVLWDRGDVAGALRLWEQYRAGEGPEPRGGPGLDQRRARLHNETFLSYVLLPDGAVVAWVFDDRDIAGQRLGVKGEELETVAARFLRECADPASDRQTVERDARRLYDWLVAPLADRLDPARTLVIEPDGAVGAIPMQALMDESSRYLGERFAVAVSGGLVDYQGRAAVGPVRAGARALVVASPTLGAEMAKTFPPLAGTVREGQSVAARFHRAVLLAGNEATLRALERHRPDTELFHFAGHGFSNAGNGGLLLSPDETVAGGAGVLDGTRMANQDWSRCRLAVLSACSTGTGETSGPVNPESLVRGLLWAGVARVVASRWNVDTETGVPFMDEFYTGLLSGDDTAAALQHAAQRIRGNKSTSHPYFWAGFQSFGAR